MGKHAKQIQTVRIPDKENICRKRRTRLVPRRSPAYPTTKVTGLLRTTMNFPVDVFVPNLFSGCISSIFLSE